MYPSNDFSGYNKNDAEVINPDYSECSGTRYYYVKLVKSGTIMGGTITADTDVSGETVLKNGSLKIELSNDKTNWMDIGKNATNGGIGATFSYGTKNVITFSIPSASAYGNGFMYARVSMTAGTTVKLASIALS